MKTGEKRTVSGVPDHGQGLRSLMLVLCSLPHSFFDGSFDFVWGYQSLHVILFLLCFSLFPDGCPMSPTPYSSVSTMYKNEETSDTHSHTVSQTNWSADAVGVEVVAGVSVCLSFFFLMDFRTFRFRCQVIHSVGQCRMGSGVRSSQ